jgi:hypothetical protein
MDRIIRYREYSEDREFKSIVASIFIILESQTGPNTFEWDFRNKEYHIDDKDDFDMGDTIVFDMEQKKKLSDYLKSIKSKVKGFRDYLNQGEEPVDMSIATNRMKELLKTLKENTPNKEEVVKKASEYFRRLIEELKSLPYEIKRNLFKRFIYVFMAVLPISEIIVNSSSDPIAVEVAQEIEKDKDNKVVKKITKPIKKLAMKENGASFDIAQKFVSVEEGGYTDFKRDKGNWTSSKRNSGCLIGTNHGIAAPTLISADILPSGGEDKMFIMCYGTKRNYESLCGKDPLTFKEQWKKDIENITKESDLEKKWKKIMKNLSYESALDIFRSDYWDAQNLDMLDNQSVANILYDGCVNQGSGAMLEVLVRAASDQGVDIDNPFSEKGMKSLNDLDQRELFSSIKKIRENMYKGNDDFDDFGKGWLSRLSRIKFMPENIDGIA